MKSSEFWLQFVVYVTTPIGDIPLCGLCANNGIVDTTGIVSPAKVKSGGRFYCICPNGRASRKKAGLKGNTSSKVVADL